MHEDRPGRYEPDPQLVQMLLDMQNGKRPEDVTVMPAEQYDALVDTLEQPDDAPRLAKLLREPTRFHRD